jgi:hypothetical protein
VIGVGFLSESALLPMPDGIVNSGGATYYFPETGKPMVECMHSILAKFSSLIMPVA